MQGNDFLMGLDGAGEMLPQENPNAIDANSLRTGTSDFERRVGRRTNAVHHAAAEEFEKANQGIVEFQETLRKKEIATTILAAAVSAVFRREYLDSRQVIFPQQNLKGNYINDRPIHWLRLSEVGLRGDFSFSKAAEALESVLNAFHLPGKAKIIFYVKSNKIGSAERVAINLGLQPLDGFALDSSMSDFISGFSRAIWPGVTFEAVGDVDFEFSDKAKFPHVGMRILTGVPSVRGRESVSATIDKLADSLRGRSWGYLVVSEPVSSSEINQIIAVCREIAGRVESMKSFQYTESLGAAIAKSFGVTVNENETSSKRKMSTEEKLALAGVVGLAGLAVCCPALIPGFLAKIGIGAAVSAATGAGSAAIGCGVAAGSAIGAAGATAAVAHGLSMLASTILSGVRTKSDSKGIADALNESVSSNKNVGFSQTVVNKHADATVKLLENQLKRFQLSEGVGAWDVGVYFIGEDETTAEIGANVLKSLISGDDSYQESVRIYNPHGCIEDVSPLIALQWFNNPNIRMISDGEPISHPLGGRFESLRSVVNTRELTYLINFPLSNVPGVPVRHIPSDMGLKKPELTNNEAIELGNQMYRGQILDKYPYAFDKDLLAKHALVCGINGSGKTNTILGILGHLLSSAAPFLVIEPAKQEYVDWAVSQNAKLIKKYKDEKKLTSEKAKEAAKADPHWITIYIPGREKWNGENLDRLSLNPFDFVWMNSEEKPKILEHIDRLKTIINAALPMQEVLPILMEELIYSVYGTKNSPVDGKYICWLPRDASSRTPEFGENIPVPSFVEMANHIPDLFKRINYGNEVQHNLRAALTTRVDSFKRGWKRPLLNKQLPRHNVEEWDKLFKHPTVINLTSLASDDDKAFFMAIILMFIYEYRQEESEMMTNNRGGEKPQGLKHLLVIEEAHRILGRCEGAASVFSAAPKQKASELFSNMISEVRAYGQGILIADQIPGRLNEDAVKNTNLKIVHRLVASDDRQAMATSLNLWNDQERIIGDLHVGEALVRCDMDNEAYMVKIKKIESVES